jgi:ATP-dependent DNA ligase
LLTWSIYRSRHRVVPATTAKNNGKAQEQPVQAATSARKAKIASPVAEKTEKETSERQKQLLQALLDLDTAYEAGKLSKSVYQERRAKTKAKLRILLHQ